MNYDLIRQLAKQRIATDPMAAALGLTAATIDSLPELQLAGLPEATILAIVETWAILRGQGIAESEIFAKIEAHRSATTLSRATSSTGWPLSTTPALRSPQGLSTPWSQCWKTL
jgi:hypothetical protein